MSPVGRVIGRQMEKRSKPRGIQRANMEKIAEETRTLHARPVAKVNKSEGSVFRTALEELRREIPYTEAIIVTTFPRGSLQIAQPATVNEAFLKAYSKDFHLEDRLTWQVMAKQEGMRLTGAWSGENLDGVRFYADFLKPAVPLESAFWSRFTGL